MNTSPTKTTTPSGAHIVVTPKGRATLHTYVSPEDGLLVTSHIIETEKSLVIVDAQFVPAFAEEVKSYADTLGKPIRRLFISHEHPDHFIGAQVFGDVPVYATAETIAFIQTAGQAIIDNYKMGTQAVVPTNIVTTGSEVIDGLTFEYRLMQNAEADVNLVILLPEIGTIVAQDIVYNQVYLYVNKKDLRNWRKAVAELKSLPGYDLVLTGHGLPTTSVVYDEVDAYLVAAERAFQDNATAQDVKDALLHTFPNLGGSLLLNLGVDHAFAA